jgi:hypothetical protein
MLPSAISNQQSAKLDVMQVVLPEEEKCSTKRNRVIWMLSKLPDYQITHY